MPAAESPISGATPGDAAGLAALADLLRTVPRRLAMLSQLGRRNAIDLELRTEVIDRNATDRDLLIREALR